MKRRAFLRLSSVVALGGGLGSWIGGCGSSSGGSGGGGNGGGDTGTRGEVLSITTRGTLGKTQMNSALQGVGLGALTPTRYTVTLYDVQYRTLAADGTMTQASGLVAIPNGITSPHPLLGYFHGTTTVRGDVPSNPVNLEGQLAVGAYAAAGYIVAAPDYLGLGSSPSTMRQTFEQAGPMATTGVDFLRAARSVVSQKGAALSDKLFLTGDSEGGYTSMAVQRALESQYTSEFPAVTANAPIAGPYDLSGTTFQSLLTNPTTNTPAYIAGLLYGYDAVYGVYTSPSQAFVAPFDGELDLLFDGTRPLSALAITLPPTPQALLQPVYLAAIQSDSNHPLRVALRANDVYDWKNLGPIRLYHGEADADVPFKNAQVAQARMQQLGGDVQVVDLGADVGHADAVLPATVQIRSWFDSLSGSL